MNSYRSNIDKIFNESCADIEKLRILKILSIINQSREDKVFIKNIAIETKLTVKDIASIVRKHNHLFNAYVKNQVRKDFNANDIKLSLTKKGLSYLMSFEKPNIL